MFNLLRAIIGFIRKDTIVLYPAIISAFISAWLMHILKITPTNTLAIGIFISISLLLSILIQLITTELGIAVIYDKSINFGQALISSTKRFFPALAGISVIILLIALVFLLTQKYSILSLALSPFLILFIFILQLFPIFYVLSKKKFWQVYQVVWLFLTKKTRSALAVFLFFILIGLITILASALLELLPLNLRSITTPVLQGLLNVMTTYAVILLWQMPNKIAARA